MKIRIPSIPIILTVLFFGLLPKTQAVAPPPDGGYPGGNTAEGQAALLSLTTGGYNTGTGWFSLKTVSSGNLNTAFGAATLFANTGDRNTATGAAALFSNTTGNGNTANGAFALFSNTTGPFNTAMGDEALYGNTTGDRNTAVGDGALLANSIGTSNTAVGVSALRNTTADLNTAVGHQALVNNTTGSFNTATGYGALANNTTGGSNSALGFSAGIGVATADNVTCIGSGSPGADVSNSTWIANVYGVTTQSGTTAPVVVSDGGQLGTVASSERFKKDIVTMDEASEIILALRPVTFHYKSDVKETPQFGLIAEEVAKVNPAMVLPDKEGKPYTVRYDAVNAMLLNEFLKEHRKVEEQQTMIAQQRKDFDAEITQLKRDMETVVTQLRRQGAKLQKVTAQIELSKSIAKVADGGH
jgi:hypothetical protein